MSPPTPFESRHINRLVGSFIIIGCGLVVFGLSRTGAVNRWFNPLQRVQVLLPQEGLFGLSEGSTVEVLGTDSGYVEAIVIEPDRQIHADILIRRDTLPFIRTDSKAIIRKRFGVAGQSYLEITRGTGEPLDWDYAVLEATADRAPTDLLQATIKEIRGQVVPTLAEAKRALTAFADIGDKLNDPEGDLSRTLEATRRVSRSIADSEGLVGRLIHDEQFADQLQSMIAQLDKDLARLEPLFKDLESTAGNVKGITAALNERSEDLPELTRRLKDNLTSLQAILADIKQASPQIPEATANLSKASAGLPSLITQSRTTLYELQKLAEQLRASWLLGGGGTRAQEEGLTPTEAMP